MNDEKDTILINDYDNIEDFEIKCLQNILAKVTSEIMALDTEDVNEYLQYCCIASNMATKIKYLRLLDNMDDELMNRLANRYIAEHPEEFDLLEDDLQSDA